MQYFLFLVSLGYCVYLKTQLTYLENTIRLFDRLHHSVNTDRHERLQKLESCVVDLKLVKLTDTQPNSENNIINFRR